MNSTAIDTVSDEGLAQAKDNARQAMLKQRKRLHNAEPNASERIKDQVIRLAFPEKTIVAGYVAMGGEVDLEPSLLALHRSGARICLPVNTDEPSAMPFHGWAPGVVLHPGPHNTRIPGAVDAPLVPDVVLVPLVAFDLAGHRLGYGKGYYDLTLNALRQHKNIVAYGVAFDGQEVDAVPHADHDALLDGVITPTRVIDCGLGDAS